MNIIAPDAKVQWLFLDLNSYFASCEQQENPALRGKPVVIVQTVTETACIIAASREAKRMGIRGGMMVREAKQKCRDVIQVKARHKIYSAYHERILKSVDSCLPIEKVVSIDEMACRLMGREQPVDAARELAMKVKNTLRTDMGECLTCSIGLAPNAFLGKVGSDLQKPDGLVVITHDNLPGVLLNMKLREICGIGPRMEKRLNHAGIHSVEDLWNAPSAQLHHVWGGIHGVLFHQMLHGADIEPPSSAETKSMGHQHVLEPEFRTNAGAKSFAYHLLAKAAERMRRSDYYCRRLGLNISWMGHQGGWWDDIGFHETCDTAFLLARLEDLWTRVPSLKPLRVSVVLLGLVPASRHQGDLFAANPQQHKLSPLIDRINQRYGRNAISFGLPPAKIKNFKGHAAFHRVPEAWEF